MLQSSIITMYTSIKYLLHCIFKPHIFDVCLNQVLLQCMFQSSIFTMYLSIKYFYDGFINQVIVAMYVSIKYIHNVCFNQVVLCCIFQSSIFTMYISIKYVRCMFQSSNFTIYISISYCYNVCFSQIYLQCMFQSNIFMMYVSNNIFIYPHNLGHFGSYWQYLILQVLMMYTATLSPSFTCAICLPLLLLILSSITATAVISLSKLDQHFSNRYKYHHIISLRELEETAGSIENSGIF